MGKSSNHKIAEERFDALEILTNETCDEFDALAFLKPDEPASTGTSMRQQERYLVRWRIAIVFDGNVKDKTYYGRVNDISMGGISVLCDHNIFHKGTVTLLLEIPPLSVTQNKKILEIKSRMVYSVLSRGSFRIGLQFIKFKPGDEQFLENRLKSNHTLYRDAAALD